MGLRYSEMTKCFWYMHPWSIKARQLWLRLQTVLVPQYFCCNLHAYQKKGKGVVYCSPVLRQRSLRHSKTYTYMCVLNWFPSNVMKSKANSSRLNRRILDCNRSKFIFKDSRGWFLVLCILSSYFFACRYYLWDYSELQLLRRVTAQRRQAFLTPLGFQKWTGVFIYLETSFLETSLLPKLMQMFIYRTTTTTYIHIVYVKLQIFILLQMLPIQFILFLLVAPLDRYCGYPCVVWN